MRRYIRSFRTRKNIHHPSALRDQFLRELTRESEALLKQLSEQFDKTLQAQLTQAVQGFSAGDASAPAPSGGERTARDTIGGIGQLLSTGARLLISRPRTSRNTVESSRSVDAAAGFRLSQSQAAAEMQVALGKGEKNR